MPSRRNYESLLTGNSIFLLGFCLKILAVYGLFNPVICVWVVVSVLDTWNYYWSYVVFFFRGLQCSVVAFSKDGMYKINNRDNDDIPV